MTTAATILTGLLVWYGGPTEPQWHGQPLYCFGKGGARYYHEDAPPWITLDISEYESGRAVCGDLLYIRFDGHSEWNFFARAWDAGYLYKPGIGIVGDIPYHLAPFTGTAQGEIVNIGAMKREANREY